MLWFVHHLKSQKAPCSEVRSQEILIVDRKIARTPQLCLEDPQLADNFFVHHLRLMAHDMLATLFETAIEVDCQHFGIIPFTPKWPLPCILYHCFAWSSLRFQQAGKIWPNNNDSFGPSRFKMVLLDWWLRFLKHNPRVLYIYIYLGPEIHSWAGKKQVQLAPRLKNPNFIVGSLLSLWVSLKIHMENYGFTCILSGGFMYLLRNHVWLVVSNV